MAAKTKRRKWLIPVNIVLGLLSIISLRAFWPLPKIKLVVSRATTYFTWPIKPDGSVDYFKAFNEAYGAGHDPRENMAIPLLEALGPQGLREEGRKATLYDLGLVLPDDGNYLISLKDFLARHKDTYHDLIPDAPKEPESKQDPQIHVEFRGGLAKQLFEQTPLERLADTQSRHATTQPWTADESPILADWLDLNAAVLDELILAERRNWFFLPLEQSGDFTSAWQTAMTLCNLGRLMSGPQSGGGALWGVGLRDAGAQLAVLIAQRADVSFRQTRDLMFDYDQLPHTGSYMGALALECRIQALGFVILASKAGRIPTKPSRTVQSSFSGAFDINEVLARINHIYDAIDDALELGDSAQRLRACRDVGYENALLVEGLRRRVDLDSSLKTLLFVAASSTEKRRFANDAMVCIPLLFNLADPALVWFEIGANMKDEFPRVALALAAYRAEHHAFPAHLSDLSPSFLSIPPRDLFTGQELRYESDGQHYRFWSAGQDQRDDGGDPKKDLVVDSSGSP